MKSKWNFISFLFIFLLCAGTGEASAKTLVDAPHIRQMPELPRGCEVTSLAMLLESQGVNAPKMTLAKEVRKVPFKQNGLHGNPYDGFVGNMYTYSQPGLGVYHGPIYDLANKYLPGRVVNLTGSNASAIYRALDNGSPVWVITNTLFKPLSSSYFQTWQTSSGPLRITYKEHSVLVTGYDSQYVYINDPLYYGKHRKMSRRNFEGSWVQMGRQAISVVPKTNWNAELTPGQTGKLTVLKPITLWNRTSSGLSAAKVLQPLEGLKVCGYDSKHGGQYKICSGGYVTNMSGYIRYETPSSAVLNNANTGFAERDLKTAISYAGSLKWEIHIDYRKDKYPGKVTDYPNMTYFNGTKKYMNSAQTAINRISDTAKKNELQASLNADVVLHYKRAQGYIDAVTSGKKLLTMTKELQNTMSADPLSDAGESLFHKLSYEIKKNAVLLYRVYGQSTREAILAAYKAPAEKEVEKHRFAITAKMKIDELELLNKQPISEDEYNTRVAEIENLVSQISDASVKAVYLERIAKFKK